METMTNRTTTSNYYRALVHVLRAARYVRFNDFKKAEEYYLSALEHADAYIHELKKIEDSTSRNSFLEKVAPYFEQLESLFPEGLQKINPTDARREYFRTGKHPDLKLNPNPGFDGRYDYKPFHQLSHEEQEKARHTYGDADMETHHYPVDKKTGELVHGTRGKVPQASQPPSLKNPNATTAERPKASGEAYGFARPKMPKPGAGVRIHDEKSEFHGRLGVVKSPNPHYPGKVAVHVQHPTTRKFETVFLDHSQIKGSRPATVAKSEDAENVLLLKSKKVLKKLKSSGE